VNFTKTKDIKLSIIKEMELKAAKVPGAVSLAQGIPSFETPESIKNFVKRAMDNNLVSKYSLCPGLPELREIISERLKSDRMEYDFDTEIIVTAGAIEGITASLLAIIEPGDEVLLPSPTYASYSEAVKIAGGVPVFVPLNEEKGWKIDTEYFRSKVTSRTKAILFCNPNNPTSTVYSEAELKELEALAEANNLFIISDEVYKDFIYNGIEFYSPAQNPKLKDKIIRVFSFSKAFAMTGWRVGFIHSSKENITEILKVHDAIVTCAPVISQYAAIAAFEMGDEDILSFKKEFMSRRELTIKRLDSLKSVFSYQKPNSAYFIFAKIKKVRPSMDFALDLLYRAKVATVPGIAFGPTGEGHIRMSFGATPETINKAFDRMDKYFKGSK